MLRLWAQLLGGPTLGPWQGMEINKAYFSAAELVPTSHDVRLWTSHVPRENDAMIPVFSQVVTSGQETLLN
jgi:hypothetical protein